jgi:predicted TIM-barrel fold metal-dependent hydrolase
MSIVGQANTRAASIRLQLGHPVIDGDGHVIELVPVFADFVRDHGREDLVSTRPFMRAGPDYRHRWRTASADERRRGGMNPAFWLAPGDTDYWLTVATPSLYYERLAEAGIDFAVLYPTMGIPIANLADTDQRVTLCRLYNEFMAEHYGPYRDRITIPAVIPMHTPEEAVAGMEHALGLGAKVALIPNYVLRPLPNVPFQSIGKTVLSARWVDTYGIDSAYNYDPVWAKAIELGLPLACHSGSMGFIDRASISNHMYNHIGHFMACAEASAKSLFFGGVTRRFPQLRVALLEGSVIAGVRLYSDLVTRWEKRGGHVIGRLNPANLDRDRIAKVLAEHDPHLAPYSPDALIASWGGPEDEIDDFAQCGVRSVEDIRDQFCKNFYWGCEADDPFVALAYDARFTPLGARVPALMGSDIGHWDVQNFDAPLVEAYELVEQGFLDLDSLREFVFTNPVSCYASLNPHFFAGTAIEKETTAALGA